MKNIRIVSDGTPKGTHIYNSDGVEIDTIRTAWVSLDAEDMATASLDISAPGIEIEVDTEQVEVVFTCPMCKENSTHKCKRIQLGDDDTPLQISGGK